MQRLLNGIRQLVCFFWRPVVEGDVVSRPVGLVVAENFIATFQAFDDVKNAWIGKFLIDKFIYFYKKLPRATITPKILLYN